MKEQRIFIFKSQLDELNGGLSHYSTSVADRIKKEVSENGWQIDQISTAIDTFEERDEDCYVLTILASKDY